MSFESIQPIHDRLVVSPDAAATETKGGILLPDNAKDKPLRGTVLAVGPGRVLDDGSVTPMPVKPGDRVLYGRYAGTEIVLGDETVVVLRAEDVLAALVPVKETA